MILHATCVATDGRGLLILGPSGSGKSSLALRMMGMGARLVADDRVILSVRDAALFATCPPALSGLIEARGLGILRADPLPEARIVLAADLARPPGDRLPAPAAITLMGCEIALAAARPDAHFPAALLLWLRHGRAE